MVRLLTTALVLAALVAGALVVRGREDPATARALDGRVTIVLDDFRIRPQVVRARRGELTIELRNEGRLGHGFRARKNGREWISQRSLAPGESVTITRRLERGDYRMYDALSNYEELGMHGTLIVR